MSSNNQLDIASRLLDITARGIDLLAVVTKVSAGVDTGAAVAKELRRWLGKEGLDEFEPGFFLKSTRALVRPNGQPRVSNFIQAVTDRKPKPSVLPLFAQPSGALGRLVASDPLQRWLTTTISCLFRYHDERDASVAARCLQIVDSNWIHIANSGIIGSDSECPRLPTELGWSCKRGHNIGSHKLALVLNRLRDPPKEVIFQSDWLLTNLVLWLVWHFDGRLRIVVSGSIVYEKVLGEADSTIECRVGRFCPSGVDEGGCTPSGAAAVPSFEMFEHIGGSLKSLFRGPYDSQQTLTSNPKVRQKLYQSPFRYPKGSQKSLEIQTQRTAQEVLRWFCGLPVEQDACVVGSGISFRLLLGPHPDWPGLRVADLLGRTPRLLNMYCGELGRPSVVFSPPLQPPLRTVDDLMETVDEDEDYDMEYDDEEDDGEANSEDERGVSEGREKNPEEGQGQEDGPPPDTELAN